MVVWEGSGRKAAPYPDWWSLKPRPTESVCEKFAKTRRPGFTQKGPAPSRLG
jgi:hypothetical protein